MAASDAPWHDVVADQRSIPIASVSNRDRWNAGVMVPEMSDHHGMLEELGRILSTVTVANANGFIDLLDSRPRRPAECGLLGSRGAMGGIALL
jgi:hypothetical protein